MSILDTIVAQKKIEIEALYREHELQALRQTAQPTQRSFYDDLAFAQTAGKPFFISEFKRKSPSEGWINQDADLPAQIRSYVCAGARAISVLTDTSFFGGCYADLHAAAATLKQIAATGIAVPLLLQKDFVLDPIQIYLARHHGADLILLIAAILSPETLDYLKKIAESLGMGVLVEVHDAAELEKIAQLDFPVLGVNNRDLKTFRTSLNRVNFLARQWVSKDAKGRRFLIAESGVKDYRDFQVVKNADGFLIGTGLMAAAIYKGVPDDFEIFYKTQGKLLFKACGIRSRELLNDPSPADYVGINFSPVSKRRMPTELLDNQTIPSHSVAVFYKNTEAEIRAILAKYPFQIVQLYSTDTTPAFVRSLKKKVFLACPVRETGDLANLERFAADVDLFILDGAAPGSGQRIGTEIPVDFPYPFLLAGGLHEGNLEAARAFEHCIGVDIASGIETDGQVDIKKIALIGLSLE